MTSPGGLRRSPTSFEVDDAGLVADGFDERTEAEIASAAQKSFPGADDQGKAFRGEGVVAQARAIQLAEDEGLDGLGTQAWQRDRVGDAGSDFLIDAEAQGLQEWRLADQDRIVRMGKVFAEHAQFAQRVGGHEVGVVEYWWKTRLSLSEIHDDA